MKIKVSKHKLNMYYRGSPRGSSLRGERKRGGEGEGRKGKGKGAPALRAYVFA